ncbi:MAG: COX15/CtaA family protein [Dehalococcoidia bacterium]|nr:COX15/CtaA family protein [Dehalococcoidia bacterium]MCA9850142.1 COX15/CtaA family protein [Dehalococcoidia bacterium]MCA9857791.1 COX15/CtaA family protein [Dehalococcoidia bacterium]MCB9490689.1 COX15/CtaA family protein [Dehalococcoidia bacterium]
MASQTVAITPVRTTAESRIRLVAWVTLALTVTTIVMGAVVRATHSGDGCGPHWPTCEGTLVLPGTGERAQLIEFSHRAVSGFSLIAVVVLAVMALRTYAAGHPARKAALWSVGFMIFEAGIGAVIVFYGWVAHDRSAARQVSVPLHLVNTFLLTAAITYTVWLIEGYARPALSSVPGRTKALLGLSFVLLLMAATGATTSLADTIFASESLREGIRQDFNSESELIVRLRILHPVVAILGGSLIAWFTWKHLDEIEDRGHMTAARVLLFGIAFQASLGFIHVALLTPVATGLVHLFIAQALWIALVWVALALLAPPGRRATVEARGG